MNDYEEQLRKNFELHVATRYKYIEEQSGDEIEAIQWKKPGSYNYFVYYTRRHNHLFVTGDLGEAVYSWSEVFNLEWMGNLDLYYFHSKCMASERGKPFDAWDSGVAIDKLQQFGKDNFEDYEETMSNFAKNGGAGALYGKREWHDWLTEMGDQVFGDYWMDWAPDLGRVIAFRCVAHWLGLKMAVEQLSKNDKKDN